MTRQSIVTVLFTCIIASAGEPPADLSQLIRETVAATEAAYRRAARYVGREEIRQFEVSPDGKRKLVVWRTFEASVLEGAPYFRLVAMNGKPLKRAQEIQQDRLFAEERTRRQTSPRQDWRVQSRASPDYNHLVLYHDLYYEGPGSIDGRPVWIIATRLRPDAPLPDSDSGMLLAANARVWLDQETKVVLRRSFQYVRPFRNASPGSSDESRRAVIGTEAGQPVFVSREIRTRIPLPNGRFTEIDQTYSDYKRFGADANITFSLREP